MHEPYQRKSDAELEQIAQDMAMGRIFSSAHLQQTELDMLPMVFLPMALMDQDSRNWFRENKVSFLYEYLEKAGPRAVNGRPCFFSVQYLDEDDATKMLQRYNDIVAFLKQRKTAESPTGATE